MTPKQIMIVEDELLVAEDIKGFVEEAGYQVTAITGSGEEALELLEGIKPHLILMDVMLKGSIDGIQAAKVIKDKYQIPVVFLTAYTDQEKLDRARLVEPYGYLVKPFDERELKTTIGVALHKAQVDLQVKQSQRYAYAVLDAIYDGVLTTDCNGKVQVSNPAAKAILGLGVDDSRPKTVLDFVDCAKPEEAEKLSVIINQMIGMGQTEIQQVECVSVNVKSRIRLLDFTFTPILDEAYSFHGIVVAFRDVTEARQNQNKLNQYRQELEKKVLERTHQLNKLNIELEEAVVKAEMAGQAKNTFLSMMAHELLTPLNPIIANADILEMSEGFNEDQRSQIIEIRESSQHLFRLVEKVLKVASEDKKQLQPEITPFSLAQCLDKVVGFSEIEAEEKGLEFELKCSQEELPRVLGEQDKLEQICLYLLENAFKFTEAGKVSLAIETVQLPGNKLDLILSVSDTGIGLSGEQISAIFEPFYQANSGLTRKFEGVGVGLTVAKQLIKSMHGRLDVDSVLSKGSTFTVRLTLPLA